MLIDVLFRNTMNPCKNNKASTSSVSGNRNDHDLQIKNESMKANKKRVMAVFLVKERTPQSFKDIILDGDALARFRMALTPRALTRSGRWSTSKDMLSSFISVRPFFDHPATFFCFVTSSADY